MSYIPAASRRAEQAALASETSQSTCAPAEAGASGGGSGPIEVPACAGTRDGGEGDAPLPPASSRNGEGERVPNLPALLVTLAEEGVEAPQIEFTTSKKLAFLEALAVVGSVRDAARRVGVSHMTAYRARRKCPAFRRCWDAALVCALPHAEQELTTRAIDGVEEDVLYHGEVVATRRRKDPRLLLAHLGRLDRLAAREDVAALSERFDDALEALARGEDLPQPAAAAAAVASARDPAGIAPTWRRGAATMSDWLIIASLTLTVFILVWLLGEWMVRRRSR